MEEDDREDQEQSNSFDADVVSSIAGSSRKKKIVGLDEEVVRLQKFVYWRTLEEEMGDSSGKKQKKMVGLDKELSRLEKFVHMGTPEDIGVMLVVGMAGIGKTTLVNQLYHDSFIRQHFDYYLFLPIGPRYQLKEILLLALKQLGFNSEEYDEKLLGRYVYESLVDSRYLVVLDDVWDTSVCEEILRVFPFKRKQSRIILTSRRLDLKFPFLYMFTRPYIIHIPFLDEDASWKLLHETVFDTNENTCHPQLEKIGRKIAKKCEGLPLAIIQVAELLSKIGNTVQGWKEIAENEDPLIIRSDDNTPLSEALYLSYTMLPPYLKVCFLYMGVFPKKYKISRQKLIKLWVSEGILEPREGKSLEEVAGLCLEELISRSVVLKKKHRSIDMRESKTCRLHFTFRNVCVSEAKSENFFPIIKTYSSSLPEDMDSQQRLCIHNNVILSIAQVRIWMESVPDVRSLLFFGPKQPYPVELYFGFRLLKVLEALAIRFYEFPDQVLELVHLKYLTITCNGELPPTVSSLLNLEVLIVHQHHIIKTPNLHVYLPIEIWNLLELKHLQCMGFDLPEPPPDNALVLRKLLILSGVSAHSCTKGVFARMPNLMKLGIRIESLSHDEVENLSFLGNFASLYEEFKSFKFVDVNPYNPSSSRVVPSMLHFPVNIKKKITLSGCGFPWERIRAIAALPNLIVLKVRWYAFCGPVWRMGVGDFPKLRFMLLEDLDLEYWKWETNENYCPVLEGLIVRHCYKLKKMSTVIGRIPALQLIEVDDCSSYLALWARRIQDLQLRCGYQYPQVKLHSSWEDKKT